MLYWRLGELKRSENPFAARHGGVDGSAAQEGLRVEKGGLLWAQHKNARMRYKKAVWAGEALVHAPTQAVVGGQIQTEVPAHTVYTAPGGVSGPTTELRNMCWALA